MRLFRCLLWLLLCTVHFVSAEDISLKTNSLRSVATAYQGRFRPMDAYAKLWLQQFYNSSAIKSADFAAFHTNTSDALDFMWQLHLNGHQSWNDAPLFWIGSAELKSKLGFDPKRERFSYSELKPKIFDESEESQRLQHLLFTFEQSDLLYVLPSRQGKGIWLPLKALLEPRNMTLWSDQLYQKLQNAYTQRDLETLGVLLDEGYTALAEKTYLKANGKSLNYPSKMQLQLETWYVQFPLIPIAIALYAIAAILLVLNPKWGGLMAWIAFALHTLILAMRIYILQRPPVSNMFETVLYVPWVGMAVGLLMRQRLALGASIIAALGLLIVMQLAQLDQGFENVQAVLDSQYWLTVHVLMVVGSYALFIMAGVLGHIYLAAWLARHKETEAMQRLARIMLQTVYIGVALLIPGTILGGVWAAQSWGRFWDWDPKESWAFISSCIYLIWIHAYTFRYVGYFGLAIGTITGLLAISFTWYGVNYILGTGLHSYGFGSGGVIWYGSYVLLEISFLALIAIEKNWGPMINKAYIIKTNLFDTNETR